eukprot:g2593.t1
MSPSALRKSNAKLTASLSRLLRNSSQKSIASGTSRASLDPNDSDLWSAAPVAPSCNTMLHAAWKSQESDAVELEDVYQHRADPWDHEHQHSRIVPPLHLVPLVGSKSRKKGRAVRPVSGAGGKLPILPFRSTCFDPPMSDRLLPEILTFPYVTDDFMESVYSITLEHSRASWSDTNTLATAAPGPPAVVTDGETRASVRMEERGPFRGKRSVIRMSHDRHSSGSLRVWGH